MNEDTWCKEILAHSLPSLFSSSLYLIMEIVNLESALYYINYLYLHYNNVVIKSKKK